MLDVELIVTEDDCSPNLSIEHACRLDDVRTAFQDGDLARAGKPSGVDKRSYF